MAACARLCTIDYIYGMHPDYKGLFTEKNEEGEDVSFVFFSPRNSEDLFRRREIIQTLGRIANGCPGGAKLTGIDGLNGLSVITRRIDAAKATNYAQRFDAFQKYLQKTDPAVALAMTEVKGDRSKRPCQQEEHKDYYLRIVDETRDGIIVRGAKMHISFAAASNEMIVLPCRFMLEDDRDYAVGFAIPPNTKGITIVAPPMESGGSKNFFDHPEWGYDAAAMVVFDDVFIPNERVFLKGEYEFAAYLAYMFANFHRLTADTYKYTLLQELVGTAALLAEYNGIENKGHVRDKLTWLAAYAETSEALAEASCYKCVTEPGTDLVYPNPMHSNLAKLHFADGYHQAIKYLQDIGGGILATVHSEADLRHPITGPLIKKYLVGKAGIPAEHRMRVIKYANTISSAAHMAATMHAEGSPAAQKLTIWAMADFEKYKAAARRACGISDGSEHETFKGLPHFDPADLPV